MSDKLKKLVILNKNEIIAISIVALVLALAISLVESIESFLYSLISIILVIFVNVIAKKIVGFYFESRIEIKIWEIRRYGFRAHDYFKKPVAIGAILPLIVTFLSLGYFTWMASLVFDAKPEVYRTAKRHGYYSFSETTEQHLGFMAAAGIFANLFFAIVGYLIGFPDFAKLNIYFALFNMLPLSDLDGNKIFFGSLPLWSFLASLVLVGLFYAIFAV